MPDSAASLQGLDPSLPVQLGKYQLRKLLAVGGMAEIYLARVTGIEGFEKHVVIKQIVPHLARDSHFVEMFLDEARLAAQLHHQNIGQVYDIGNQDGRYFFAMEYLHGRDARDILRRVRRNDERLPLEHALTIVAGAAAGLHYAHDQLGPGGSPLMIVHRDVSPSNVFITYDGGVKLVDFGIARATTRTSETRTGSIKGKLAYMSPEQCTGEELDRRTDIFSLGVVLYELSTSSRLFRKSSSESDYVVMDRIVKGAVPRPSVLVPGYPVELEQVVLRALALEPSKRYPTAQDMLLDLEGVAAARRLPLSQASLSRYVRALFGPDPEPWRDGEGSESGVSRPSRSRPAAGVHRGSNSQSQSSAGSYLQSQSSAGSYSQSRSSAGSYGSGERSDSLDSRSGSLSGHSRRSLPLPPAAEESVIADRFIMPAASPPAAPPPLQARLPSPVLSPPPGDFDELSPSDLSLRPRIRFGWIAAILLLASAGVGLLAYWQKRTSEEPAVRSPASEEPAAAAEPAIVVLPLDQDSDAGVAARSTPPGEVSVAQDSDAAPSMPEPAAEAATRPAAASPPDPRKTSRKPKRRPRPSGSQNSDSGDKSSTSYDPDSLFLPSRQ